MIDPEKLESIDKVPIPKTRNKIHSFFGQINFIRKFISNFVEMTIPITRMLKKDLIIKWEEKSIQDFTEIKETLKNTPLLAAPNYKMTFQIFSFTSKNTIVFVLLQKDEEGNERYIAFFSKSL